MRRTDYQSKHLHSLLTKLQVNQESKEDMINSFTNGRTLSTKEMTFYECRDMITALEKMLNSNTETQSNRENENREKEDLLQKERRKIFVLMYDCGFISNTDDTKRKMQVLNGWIRKKMNLTTDFNSLSIDELLKMNKQLQTVRRLYSERLQKISNFN